MNGFRGFRNRDFLRQRGRRLTLQNAVPSVRGMLDNYVLARRGELRPARSMRWGRIVSVGAVAVAGITGLFYFVGPIPILQFLGCPALIGVVIAGIRALVLRNKRIG